MAETENDRLFGVIEALKGIEQKNIRQMAKDNRQLREDLNRVMEQQEMFHGAPDTLYEPVRYIMSLGGKRLRPVLALMACQLFKGDTEKALLPALGLEVFHNFTLLHDDVMDRADMRRGKPTVNVKWNSNVAILSGDVMFAMACRLICQAPDERKGAVLEAFNDLAVGVCEGQQYDMDFETQEKVSMAEYMEMIRLKTAVLIAGALKVGALLAGASEEDLQPLYEYGTKIGLAFQLQDDLLDLYGDEAKFGKKLGSDIRENKKTYLYIKALELLEEVDAIALEHEFSTPTLPFGDIAKIKKVKALYEKVKVKDHCEKAVSNLFAEAGEALDRLSASPAVDPQALSALRAFGSELLGREV